MTASRLQELTTRKAVLQAVIRNGYAAVYTGASLDQKDFLDNYESLTRDELVETIEEIDAAVEEAAKLKRLYPNGNSLSVMF